MTEKTLTTENIKPALDALRGELAPWPVVAKKQDRLNDTQKSAVNSGITSSLVAQIIANTAAIRALESAITGTGLRALVVASLPAVGTTGILYIVPVTTYDPDTDADVVNYSNEYIWIPVEGGLDSEGHYEQVGQTGIVINNGQLTITVNGTSVGTFTANQSGDMTAAITVPTNADYVDRTTDQTVAGVKTFSSTIEGTASKAIADEDGTSIKTGYVNVAGNQTVSGQKDWTDTNTFSKTNSDTIRLKNGRVAIGETISSDAYTQLVFKDKNTDNLAYIRNNYIANGTNNLDFYVRNKFSNGSPSTTGSVVYTFFGLSLDNTGKSYARLKGDFYPYANNLYSLGSSSYQWSSVYAQSYYYNGTAWGLDKANVWTKNNRFSKNSALSDITSYTDTSMSFTGNSNTIFFNTRGSSNYPSYGTFLFAGYMTGTAPDRYSQLKLLRSTDLKGGTNDGYVPDTSFNLWRVSPHYSLMDFMEAVRVQNNGPVNFLAPITTNATDLGTSTNKWKTLNGINPGALSLPDVSKSVTVDIPVDWVTDGSAWNDLNVSNMGDGWLCLTYRLCGANDYILARLGGTNANVYPSMLFPATLLGDSKYYIFAFLPVTKAMGNIRLEIHLTSGSVVVNHSFYPCLGNV